MILKSIFYLLVALTVLTLANSAMIVVLLAKKKKDPEPKDSAPS